MKTYVKNFLIDFDFEEEDRDCLFGVYSTIVANGDANEILCGILEDYNNNMNINWDGVLEKVKVIANITDIHEYTVYLVVCICLSRKLKDYYAENNISLDVWRETVADFKYKLTECKLIKGICGAFCFGWHGKFFHLNLFAFGRLQFRMNTLRYDYNKNGIEMKIGDPVVDIHIPRTGTPIDEASCRDSYKRAKEFFKDRFKPGKPIPFVCSSWLLSEVNLTMLSEKSNIRRFIGDFEILANRYMKQGDYSETWRLFDMDYTGNLDDFPEDSSFRRAYKKYLKEGGRFGSAYGIFFM